MTLLYCYRHRLRSRQSGRSPAGIAGRLLSPEGLHTACTCVYITDQTLVISYTYCTLAFSRLMRWFEHFLRRGGAKDLPPKELGYQPRASQVPAGRSTPALLTAPPAKCKTPTR